MPLVSAATSPNKVTLLAGGFPFLEKIIKTFVFVLRYFLKAVKDEIN